MRWTAVYSVLEFYYGYFVVLLEEVLYDYFPGLAAVFEVEMQCSSSTVNSEASLDTTF